jgi:transposase
MRLAAAGPLPVAPGRIRQDRSPFQPGAGAAGSASRARSHGRCSRRATGKRSVASKGASRGLSAVADAHPGKRLQLCFQDEARVGNKGRVCHRWWRRGEQPPRACTTADTSRPTSSAQCDPLTGEDFTLSLPEVSTRATRLFFDAFARTLPNGVHAVVILDGAGWHHLQADSLSANLSLVRLPSYSPELNQVERVWIYLRERYLSLRVLDNTEAVVDACCHAWRQLIAEPDRIRTLYSYPSTTKVASWTQWYQATAGAAQPRARDRASNLARMDRGSCRADLMRGRWTSVIGDGTSP